MNIQEQEHIDFVAGCASEAQNCFEEAQVRAMRLQGEANKPISRWLRAGLFVLVRWEPYYCKATDAHAGDVAYFVMASRSREQCIAAGNRLAVDPEVRLEILSPVA